MRATYVFLCRLQFYSHVIAVAVHQFTQPVKTVLFTAEALVRFHVGSCEVVSDKVAQEHVSLFVLRFFSVLFRQCSIFTHIFCG